MGLDICVVMVLVLVGCGVLYGPLIGPNPEHCANNPGICTEAQQCNTKTGFCVDAINDMTQRAPAVASVSPKAGRNNVATTITIMGSNFHESPVVTVGGVACGAVVRDSENKITCQVEPRPGTCGPQDIVVTNSDDQQSGIGTKLFTYGTTSRTFQSAFANLMTASEPWGIEVGDFDNDGNLDLVAGSRKNSGILLFKGKGDGSFVSPPSTYNITGYTVALAAVDLDRNGNLDLLAVSFNPGIPEFYLHVIHGNGAGSLTEKSHIALPSFSGTYPGLAVADFNGDKIPDVLVSNPANGTISVILGNSAGIPTKEDSSVTGSMAPGPLAVGDFDGDGAIDFAVSGIDGIAIAKGDGKGMFTSATSTGTTTSRAGLATADINQDNKLDLVYAVRNLARVGFRYGQGDLTFKQEIQLSVSSALPEVIRLADLDADGYMDALVTFDDTGYDRISIFYGAQNTTYSQVDPFATGARPRDAVIADFNKDGLLDFALLQYDNNSIGVFTAQCK